jgi:hypothetical protein
VKALVNAKESEEMSRWLGRSGAAFALPEEGGKIVCLAQNGAFADVKVLHDGF